MIISIYGKVSDMFCLSVEEYEYNGYVPDGLGIGGGDDIELRIDNDTGKIVGWVPLTIEKIKEKCEDDEY